MIDYQQMHKRTKQLIATVQSELCRITVKRLEKIVALPQFPHTVTLAKQMQAVLNIIIEKRFAEFLARTSDGDMVEKDQREDIDVYYDIHNALTMIIGIEKWRKLQLRQNKAHLKKMLKELDPGSWNTPSLAERIEYRKRERRRDVVRKRLIAEGNNRWEADRIACQTIQY